MKCMQYLPKHITHNKIYLLLDITHNNIHNCKCSLYQMYTYIKVCSLPFDRTLISATEIFGPYHQLLPTFPPLLLTIKNSIAKQYSLLSKTTSSMEWNSFMTSSMLHHFLSKPLDVHSLLVDTLSTNLSKYENNCDPLPTPLFYLIFFVNFVAHLFSSHYYQWNCLCCWKKWDQQPYYWHCQQNLVDYPPQNLHYLPLDEGPH